MSAGAGLVLLARDGLVVADKPAGLPSTGRTLDDPDCLQAVLLAHLGRRRIWAVHQIDRETSGLNLFVTRKPLVAPWAEALAAGHKRYLALVDGRLEGPPREVDAPIGRARRPDGREVSALVPDGRPARSTVRPLAASADGRTSLVEVAIHTGRTHQARLHLLSLGHPVLGEPLHRDPPCRRTPRLALHAWRLELTAPDGAPLALEARIPADFAAWCAAAGLPLPP